MIIKNLIGSFFCVMVLSANAQVKFFHLADVELISSPFKQAQEIDARYMLSLHPDRLLAPFLKEAGLKPKAENYGNWENSGLDGHVGGHYLSALANMCAATKDTAILHRLQYMIGELSRCQLAGKTGYIGGTPGGRAMWEEIKGGNIKAEGFALNTKWVPLYNIHKLFAGLIDAYRIVGLDQSKQILLQLSDWFYGVMSLLEDHQIQEMLLSEHGGINEALVDVFLISGEKKYLELAKRFSHRFILDPLMQQRDTLTKLHANTQIPKVIGFARIASEEKDTAWRAAADFFWQTVTQHRSISIGGNSVSEHFHPATDFSSMLKSREGPETCNSYNMLKLTKQLFLDHPLSSYMDYYERILYNHILASQHPAGGFVYFTSARPGHYRVYSSPQESFWCCVGSGMENHGKYGEMIYAYHEQELYVNLFIPSILSWKEKGLVLKQDNQFPGKAYTSFQINLAKPINLILKIRYPEWIASEQMKILVNGKKVSVKVENGYISIARIWENGDQLHVDLPMNTIADPLPDGSPWASFRKGPVVMATTWKDTTELSGFKADGSRMGHIANGKLIPLAQLPLIVSSTDKTSFVEASYLDGRKQRMRLQPFYQIHDSRYILYWRMQTDGDVNKIREEFKKLDQTK